MNRHPRTILFAIVGAALAITIALNVFATAGGQSPAPFVLHLHGIPPLAAAVQDFENNLRKHSGNYDVNYYNIHGDNAHLVLDTGTSGSQGPLATVVRSAPPDIQSISPPVSSNTAVGSSPRVSTSLSLTPTPTPSTAQPRALASPGPQVTQRISTTSAAEMSAVVDLLK